MRSSGFRGLGFSEFRGLGFGGLGVKGLVRFELLEGALQN